MQPWQIKVLELEGVGLKHFHGFDHDHALCFLTGAIYLLLALLAWVLNGALRKRVKSVSYIPPIFFIHLPGPPPPPQDTFDPFPPPHRSAHCDCDDDSRE